MLVKVWKRKFITLLIGVLTGTAIIENGMESFIIENNTETPRKLKIGISINPTIPLLSI